MERKPFPIETLGSQSLSTTGVPVSQECSLLRVLNMAHLALKNYLAFLERTPSTAQGK